MPLSTEPSSPPRPPSSIGKKNRNYIFFLVAVCLLLFSFELSPTLRSLPEIISEPITASMTMSIVRQTRNTNASSLTTNVTRSLDDTSGVTFPSTGVSSTEGINKREANSLVQIDQKSTQTVPLPVSMCPHVRTIPIGTRFSRDGQTIYQAHTYYSTRWGNVLSPYWAARAMAELGGFSYVGKTFGRGSWMEHLPARAPAKPPQLQKYLRACKCAKFVYFHDCEHGWAEIGATIAKDTRTAVRSYAATVPNKSLAQIPFTWNDTDWLIYERCCILCHPGHGFVNIHAMDVLPKTGSYNVYTLTPRGIDQSEGNGMCGRLHALRDEYIKWRNPHVNLVTLQPSDLWVDYARIVFAPNFVIPSAGTSWGLWAFLANTGNVYVAQPNVLHMHTPDLPSNVHVLDLPVMTIDMARRTFNISSGHKLLSEGRRRLETWFLGGWTPPLAQANKG